MAQHGKPRRGSLQFSPRKRAKTPLPRVRSWPEGDGILGFIGYKVGMASAKVKTTNPQSPFTGKEIVKSVTVLEVPPMLLRAVRLYKKTAYGSKVLTEFSNFKDVDISKADFARLIFETQPSKAGFPRKNPEVAEIAHGGTLEETLTFAKENMDKELKFSDVFSEHEFMDVTGVTKGKGFQGPVRRFGVHLLPYKTEKSRRKPGSLGPWTPEKTPWQVAMAGQTGYHTRTEYNKQVLKIGTEDINPKSGWKRYGLVKSDYVLVVGSVQGPAKRTIRMKKATRPGKNFAVDFQGIVMDGGIKK